MSGQSLAGNPLAGIADILPPSVPLAETGTASSLWFAALAIVIIAGFLLRWRMGARSRLLRLARACESGMLGSRDAAHRLAAELSRYCIGDRLNETNPPQGVSVDMWLKFLSVLASQRFGPQEPEAHAVAQSIRQAERWLGGGSPCGLM